MSSQLQLFSSTLGHWWVKAARDFAPSQIHPKWRYFLREPPGPPVGTHGREITEYIMPGLIGADSRHVDMGTSGRHADEAFISTTTNEPFRAN